ncbi:hypothetical protein L1987_62375 [Smallanthus sonchifolius]|uniref:Uncharacterized protein n=1 Tax=Smallanthus sonchifolius TaxID=185202 RepID=A0ACB9CA75_9ASTR|nr:hypothetical protein L1987_62375 [Smallanthus sonchifolius]
MNRNPNLIMMSSSIVADAKFALETCIELWTQFVMVIIQFLSSHVILVEACFFLPSSNTLVFLLLRL